MNVAAPRKTQGNATSAEGGRGIESAKGFIVAHLRAERVNKDFIKILGSSSSKSFKV